MKFMKKEKTQIRIIEFILGTTKVRVMGRSGKEYITDYGQRTCECDYMQNWSTGKACAHLNHVMANLGGPDWSMPAEAATP
jgi:hypothetical protein